VTDIGLGALCAVTASSLFSVGMVLQAIEARTVPARLSFHVSLLAELLRHPRWVLGGAVMLVGFGFHVTAFLVAPLTVVQPALAAGLLVLLAFGLRAQGETINRRELLGVAGIVVGIVALTFTTPGRTADEAGPRSLVISLGTLALIALVPHLSAIVQIRRGGGASMLATLGAGAGYALTGLTTKLLSDAIAAGRLVQGLGWLALTALVAGFAFLDQTSALQSRDVIEVGPIVFVVPIVVPVLLAPLLVGEGWSGTPLGPVGLIVALAIVCAGAVTLSGSATVSAAQAAPIGDAGDPVRPA
jgi:drug/metabolite transporter (DMT)-like permease